MTGIAHASSSLGCTQQLGQGTPGELNTEQQEVLMAMNGRLSRVLTESIDKCGVSWRYRLQPLSPAAYLPRNRAEDGAVSDFVRAVGA